MCNGMTNITVWRPRQKSERNDQKAGKPNDPLVKHDNVFGEIGKAHNGPTHIINHVMS